MKNKNQIRAAVIMAGGSGERFWPLSRRTKPKQMLRLTESNHTLLEQTIENISPIFPKEYIYIFTATHLIESIRKMMTGIPDENIIAEPYKRNTSGCLALAAAELMSRLGHDNSCITVGIFPADHNISDRVNFHTSVEAALISAEDENALVTLGIKPVRPETGYGYIETTKEKKIINKIPVYSVNRFHEKPDRETAKEYISAGNFYWNSGMFFWKLSTFLDELSRSSPDILKSIEIMTEALISKDKERFLATFKEMKDISIDYALMENANRVIALETDFGWDDIGAWDALDRIVPSDENGNIKIGSPLLIDSKNCIVYNDLGIEKTAVGIVGVENLVVIVTDDGILIVPKDRVQNVKKVISELKEKNPEKT